MSDIPKFDVLPEHIGIIMDGNGRWAKQRGLKRTEGHKEGAKVFKRICEYAADIGIKYLTFYAFSTENWKRPPEEVSVIMDIFRDYLGEAEERQEENRQKQLRMRFIGIREGIPEDIQILMDQLEKNSDDKNKTVVNLAINYGGRSELVNAVKKISKKVASGELSAEDIDEEMISSNLYTANQPDPDIIIRPSGEYRLSNFMIWQAAYSEFWYSDVLWPDFTEEHLISVLRDYEKRNRRFGGI
ncbi:MAG: isoprenyl transferase [Ruminococcaceae bacterium]|nr:isoprenyl transferase [Oscillospiraceae bacterium]